MHLHAIRIKMVNLSCESSISIWIPKFRFQSTTNSINVYKCRYRSSVVVQFEINLFWQIHEQQLSNMFQSSCKWKNVSSSLRLTQCLTYDTFPSIAQPWVLHATVYSLFSVRVCDSLMLSLLIISKWISTKHSIEIVYFQHINFTFKSQIVVVVVVAVHFDKQNKRTTIDSVQWNGTLLRPS